MMNYLKKFTMEILPSVAATIIGAYIVNHYIVSKPGADAPVAAAVSAADPKAASNVKPAETSAHAGNIPAAGVKAKGISEKAILEKTASEGPASAEKPASVEKAPSVEKSASVEKSVSVEKPAEKSTDTPAETASIPAGPRRHQSAPREKVRVVLPSPVQPAAPNPVQPAAPIVAAVPSPAAPVEAAVAPEERRDANDLARAAIERLRGGSDNASRPHEVARTPEPPRTPEVAHIPDAPRVVMAPAVRPLPPPIMVSTPSGEAADQGAQPKPSYGANARIDDPQRPTPPADIPSQPLDLRAEAVEPPPHEHTNVAEDVLSAAKSVFHAVLPK